MKDTKNLVYSTDPVLNQSLQSSLKRQTKTSTPNDGIVRIHRETKGRGGKGVSVVTGLRMNDTQLKELAKQLKQQCGTGGTVKTDCIEIQGDQRDKIKSVLEALGHTVKLAGG